MKIEYSKIAKSVFEKNKDLEPSEQRALAAKEMKMKYNYNNQK